jgi:small-conductance mechanosensitive channel
MRFFIPVLTALFLSAALPVAGVAQDTAQPTGTIAVEDSAQQDAAIAVRIRDILGELDGYNDITVTVSSGIVSLNGNALDGTAIERLGELVSRVDGVVTIENGVTETTDLAERLNPAIERFLTRMQQFIAFIPLMVVSFIAFAIIVYIGLFIARRKQPWDRMAPNMFIADIYRQIIRVAFVIAAIVVALDIMGATALLSTIMGAAGIIGLAIGFAVRDTVENFIASIMLSMRQPFRPNDLIEIGGDTGKVIRLTSRATILLSLDGNHIRIPNATVFKSRIVNYSRNRERRFTFDLGIAADSDLTRARQIVETALGQLPFILKEPSASVWVENLGDSSVTLRVTAWFNQRESSGSLSKGEAINFAKGSLEAEGITLPEPSYRLIMDGDSSTPGKSRKTAKKPVKKHLVVGEVDALDEQALERIVNEERQDTGGGDLLNNGAPEE